SEEVLPRADDVVHEPLHRRGVEIAYIEERERHRSDVPRVAVESAHAVLRETRVADRVWTGIPLVVLLVSEVLVLMRRQPVAPCRAVGARAHVDDEAVLP